MSGYLQRLAGSVIRPKEAIRPLVGSIYAGNTATSAKEAFDDSEHESTRLISAHRIVPPHEGPRLMEESDRPGELDHTEKEERIPQTETAFANEPRERRNEVPPSSRAALREEEALEHENTAKPIGIYIPLLASSSTGMLNHPIARAPEVFSPSVQNSQHKTASPQSAQREPDEIQIHIGRIEVSAMMQPAPATVPRTPRTPSSLDEYLQRRDRRRT